MTIPAMSAGSKVSKALIAKICIPVVAVLAGIGGLFAWNALHQRTDHFAAIPADACVVMKVSAGQLLGKSNIAELEEWNDLIDEAREEIDDSDLEELFDKVVKDPSTSGFDLAAPMALSVSNIENPQIMFVAAVDDREVLEANIQTILDAQGSDDVKMKIEDDYTTLRNKHDKSVDVAFDDDRFVVVVSPNGSAKKATRFVEQKKDESVLSNASIGDFIASTDDVSLFVDGDPIYDFAKNTDLDGIVAKGFDFKSLKGVCSYTSLNFEEGKIVLRSKNYPSEELKETTEGVMKKPQGKYLDEMPEDTYAAMQYGIGDLKPFIQYLLGAVPSRELNALNSELEKYFGSGATLAKVAGYFSGDFAMYVAGNLDDLTWGLNISCNKKVTDAFSNLIDEESAREYSTWERDGDDYVSVSWYDREPQFYVRMTNDGIRISSKKQRPKNTLRGAENAKYLENNGGFIDFERIYEIDAVKEQLKKEAGLYAFCRLFKVLHFTSSESGYQGEMVLELTEQKGNSLSRLIAACIEFYNVQKKSGSLLNSGYGYKPDSYDDSVAFDTVSDYYGDDYVEDTVW